ISVLLVAVGQHLPEALRQDDVLGRPAEERRHLLRRVPCDPAADLGQKEAQLGMPGGEGDEARGLLLQHTQPRHRVDAVRLPLQPLGLPPDRAELPVRLPRGPAAVGAVRVGPEDEDLNRLQGVVPRHASVASTCSPRCCSRYTAAFCRSPARSWSVSSRRTLPGTPATSEPGGMSAPSSTTAPPATRHPAPMRAPLRTTAPMPISEPSPIVQPWTTA